MAEYQEFNENEIPEETQDNTPKCPACNQNLCVAKGEFKTGFFTRKVYLLHSMVCMNPKCTNYCGPNLNNADKVIQVVKNKVN